VLDLLERKNCDFITSEMSLSAAMDLSRFIHFAELYMTFTNQLKDGSVLTQAKMLNDNISLLFHRNCLFFLSKPL